ncbi:retrovirus-related pol polyprotein from transposon TNT 1-94 [Tanacetum coccineum]
MANTSHVKCKKTKVEEHPRISSISNQTKSVTACNDSLNSRTSNVNAVCATCGKCVFNSNHDACVSKFLNDVNARTKKPNVVPISTRKPKSQANKSVATPHKKTVASESTITNSKSYYRIDGENLDKMKEKGDPCILVGYSTQSKGYRVYNKRTRLIVESIHLRFDEIQEIFIRTLSANRLSGLVRPTIKGVSAYKMFHPSAIQTFPSQQENPSKPVQTRRQLATDPEMCMFALTVSTAEPKNIKEAMLISAWIEAMQEELQSFDNYKSGKT